MAEHPFRILLDFRELNFKFYKFVWMSILPRELVTIKDLKDAILKKFSFEQTDLQLFLRDGLLPEDENISNILRENDSVRLFYAEPPNLNLNDSRTINYEEVEPSTSDDQGTSSKKRKTHSDVSINLEDNEQVKSNKKRKHSFSNGTYLFENNSTPENSASINVVPDNIENVSGSNLNNFENQHYKSCKVKKKLKYTNDVSLNSLISEKETFLSADIIPRSEKNESRVNSCKKKKKHKHSKDVPEKKIILHNDIVTMSEIKENESMLHKKKKKPKRSHGASKSDSMSKTAVSFSNEILSIAGKLDDSVNGLESLNNELSGLKESFFETVTDDSEVLKLGPVSFSASSVNTSSGIGSLKSSKDNNQMISPKKNSSKSDVSDSKPVFELVGNNLSGQGNNCKKKKRKRHRKRKSLLINPQVDVSTDWNLDVSAQKIENVNSSFTSSFYQTAEISPRNKETADSSKSNAYLSKKNTNCSEKSIFLEPFSSCLPNTSTPFSQTNIVPSASLRNNAMPKFSSSSNVFQDPSHLATTSQNTTQKKMNGNYLSTHSLPCSATKNKNIAAVSSHNFNEKTLSPKISYSSEKSTDSFSNKGTNSPFLNPNFSYEGCPPLNSCPLVGTHIAYKVLELDATYSPVVSNYKEGLVKAVNSQTDELEIELIEPEFKEGRTGKFENLYEDELPPCEVVKKVTLSWPSLIDPVRVVYE